LPCSATIACIAIVGTMGDPKAERDCGYHGADRVP